MKRLAVLIACSVFSLACGAYVDPMPVGPDLATAPLGGEYFGVGKLERDSCNGYDKDSEADKEYFEPFFINMKLRPENEDHSELNVTVGEVNLEDVKPVRQMVDGIDRYVFDHEFSEEGYLDFLVLQLKGTVVAGEMNLFLFQNIYEGTAEARGEEICEVLFNLHLKKVVNYPYVRP